MEEKEATSLLKMTHKSVSYPLHHGVPLMNLPNMLCVTSGNWEYVPCVPWVCTMCSMEQTWYTWYIYVVCQKRKLIICIMFTIFDMLIAWSNTFVSKLVETGCNPNIEFCDGLIYQIKIQSTNLNSFPCQQVIWRKGCQFN